MNSHIAGTNCDDDHDYQLHCGICDKLVMARDASKECEHSWSDLKGVEDYFKCVECGKR